MLGLHLFCSRQLTIKIDISRFQVAEIFKGIKFFPFEFVVYK